MRPLRAIEQTIQRFSTSTKGTKLFGRIKDYVIEFEFYFSNKFARFLMDLLCVMSFG
jgi:hypothetical protein